ncbi:hypothetical protein [Altererythrobacter sp.]|uniref:hypothetical protein n=1 Tax=Altererythrobacter sp. TaxID=1872480 RepID=UPI003D0EFA8B
MPSPLSLAAILFYLAVSASCLFAMVRARVQAGSVATPNGDAATWFVLTMLFILLALSRFYQFEDLVRLELREMLLLGDAYGERRIGQYPLALLALVVTGGVLWRIWRSYRRRNAGVRSQSLLVARLAAVVMVGLVVLRVISLHLTDSVLFRGLHLNWAIDLGASAAVGIAAWKYARSLSPGAASR